jgi:hypothetical protein
VKLKQVGSNMTEIELSETESHVNRRVLYSYGTPVAFAETGPEGRIYYRTEERYSVTTSRHINKWLPKEQAIERPQAFFDALV